MTDSTVTNLQAMVSLLGVDILHIVDDPSGTPTNKKITLNTFFGNVPANTVISATLTVGANTTLNGRTVAITANTDFTGDVHLRRSVNVVNTAIRIANTFTPGSNAISHGGKGTMFWDESYLYMETANSTIRRIPWELF